jgi:hypothetical protein
VGFPIESPLSCSGIYVDVRKEDNQGNVRDRQGARTNPHHLTRTGWTKDSVKPGDDHDKGLSCQQGITGYLDSESRVGQLPGSTWVVETSLRAPRHSTAIRKHTPNPISPLSERGPGAFRKAKKLHPYRVGAEVKRPKDFSVSFRSSA